MTAVLLAFVLGTALLQTQATLPAMTAALVLLPLILAACTLPPRWRWSARCLAGLLAGFFWAALLASERMAEQLPLAWEGKDIAIIVAIRELPTVAERAVRLRVDVTRTQTPGVAVPGHLQLGDFRPGAGPYQPGQRWRMVVRLKRAHASANPHAFDAESWMLQQGIRATGTIRQAVRLDDNAHAPLYLINRCRAWLRQRYADALSGRPYAGVLIALTIGDQQAIPQTQWTVFNRTGITHLVSISGLHITLLAGLMASLVYRCWRLPWLLNRWPARKAAVLAGMVTALAYSLLAGWSVPTQRTCLMLMIAAVSLWSGRPQPIFSILVLALAAVAIMDPWAALTPGFWLSFGAVGLLVWVGANRLQRPHWLIEWGRTQWAVTIGLTPALLGLFQQVPLTSPLANALAIPLVSFIVTPLALLGAVFAPLLPVAHAAFALGMRGLDLLARLPFALWSQAMPPVWALLAALVGIVWLLLPRGWPARWLGLSALVPLLCAEPDRPEPGSVRVVVIDVGQGLAVWVRTASHDLLYDAGAAFSAGSDSANRVILPLLRGEGVRQLDGLVISHNDIDHSGGAASVLAELPVGWMRASLPRAHPLWRKTTLPIVCQAGQHWEWDQVEFRIVSPAVPDETQRDNAQSCVLHLNSRWGSVLLPGDIERNVEQTLAAAGQLAPADVVLAPHHGSGGASSPAFIAATRPKLVIFSQGYRNRFRHPRAQVVDRYRQAGAVTLRSDDSGAIRIDLGPDGLCTSRFRDSAARYWRQ